MVKIIVFLVLIAIVFGVLSFILGFFALLAKIALVLAGLVLIVWIASVMFGIK